VEEWDGGSGRPLQAFRIAGQGAPRPVLLAVARVHPYETAGSHCLQGALDAVLCDADYRSVLLRRFDWAVVPVASPDGVAAGYCRYSARNGLGFDASRQDREGEPLSRLVDHVASQGRLTGYLDIHNWMHGDVDGVRCRNRLGTWRFVRELRRLGARTKDWRATYRHGLLASSRRGVMARAARAGADCLALEYPWAGRTPADMAELGRKTLLAFAASHPGGRRA
jgi:hypothetical protein